MLRGWTRKGLKLTGHARTAVVCAAGLATLGCAGSKIDLAALSPPSAEKKGGDEPEQRDTEASTTETGFEKLLRLRQNANPPDHTDGGTGRVFSAFVDRLAGRRSEPRDPFLEPAEPEPQSANQPAAIAASRPRHAPVNSESRVESHRQRQRAAAEPRSDNNLWRMFISDAGTTARHTEPPSPSINTRNLAGDTTPDWARRPETSPHVNRSGSLEAAAFQQSPDEAVGRARVASAVETTNEPPGGGATASFSRMHVDSLMAQVRLQEQRGDLIAAYRTAVAAAEVARKEQIVFAPRDEQPKDAMRRLTAQMRSAHRNDPFHGDSADEHESSPFGQQVASEQTKPVALPLPTPDSAPETTVDAVVTPVLTKSPANDPPSTESPTDVPSEFPTLHEWRGVAANQPVSLAVVDPTRDPTSTSLQHRAARATLTETRADSSLTGPLRAPIDEKARKHVPRRRQAMLAPVRSRVPAASATGENLRPTPSKLALGSLPPANMPVDLNATATTTLANGDSSSASKGGAAVWWVLGALCMVATAVFVRLRPGRRIQACKD